MPIKSRSQPCAANLDLRSCKITDDGLLHLAELPLVDIDICGCNDITEPGLEKLLFAIPNMTYCHIKQKKNFYGAPVYQYKYDLFL